MKLQSVVSAPIGVRVPVVQRPVHDNDDVTVSACAQPANHKVPLSGLANGVKL